MMGVMTVTTPQHSGDIRRAGAVNIKRCMSLYHAHHAMREKRIAQMTQAAA